MTRPPLPSKQKDQPRRLLAAITAYDGGAAAAASLEPAADAYG